MSYNNNIIFNKDNLNFYLNELSKEYKKLGGRNTPAEIILIGGAAILASFGFRDTTTDIDAIITSASSMKEAINRISDKHHLPTGWLNNDFVKTKSYSPKLSQYSVHYKTFNQVLDVRIVQPEYLIAMKLKSGRKYKNDLSDIIGILKEQESKGKPLTLSCIKKAFIELYGSWNNLSDHMQVYIESLINNKTYQSNYDITREKEKATKAKLIQFEEDYPDVLSENNIDSIIDDFKSSQEKSQIDDIDIIF